MAEGVGSPEASAEAAAFSLPNSRSPPGSLSHPVEEEAGPSSFLSPKKQKTDTGHAVSLSNYAAYLEVWCES